METSPDLLTWLPIATNDFDLHIFHDPQSPFCFSLSNLGRKLSKASDLNEQIITADRSTQIEYTKVMLYDVGLHSLIFPSRLCRWFALGVLAAALSSRPHAALPGSVDPSFQPVIPSTNRVGAVAVDQDGRVLAAIGFDLATAGGPWFRGRSVARFGGDGSTNTVLATVAGPLVYEGASGAASVDYSSIDVLAVQPDGSLLLAGLFVTVNGLNHHDLARLDADGSVVADFQPDPGIPVYSPFMPTPAPMITEMLPLQDGRVLVTGFFNMMNGYPLPQLAVIRADGKLDAGFAYRPTMVDMVESISNQPFPVAQTHGHVFVAGTPYGGLTGANTVSSNLVRRLNNDGSLDLSFAPVSLSYSFATPGITRFLRPGAVQTDGKLLLIGNFSAINGVSSANMARVNTDGVPDSAFNSRVTVDGPVQCVLVQADGRIVLGGDFARVNGSTRPHVARLNSDGTLDAEFNPGAGPNGQVLHIALHGADGLLISGPFSSADGQKRPGLARLFAEDPSALRLSQPTLTKEGLRIFVSTVPGAAYELERTADLGQPWRAVLPVQGLGAMQAILLPTNGSQALFRLRRD
ncbi:MAG: delta-60 repeat domain-containing protein [Verrucomicrobiota bacterium]